CQRCRSLFRVTRHAPLFNACARANPLIICIHDLFKVVVGNHLIRHTIAPADDLGIAPPALYPAMLTGVTLFICVRPSASFGVRGCGAMLLMMTIDTMPVKCLPFRILPVQVLPIETLPIETLTVA